MTQRKGIILAGGSGTRLHPATLAISKQLLPVYDKPMIYYPLSTLMLAGIRDILVISTPQDTPRFQQLLGDGSQWGMNLQYCRAAQPRRPGAGLHHRRDVRRQRAQRAGAGRQHLLRPRLCARCWPAPMHRASGATVFAYHVHDPERYGVVAFDAQRPGHQHRGKARRSPRATTPSPACTSTTSRCATSPRPSSPAPAANWRSPPSTRPTWSRAQLNVEIMGRGYAWLDTGTHDSLLEASQFIATLEKRQGLKVACPEEIAWRNGWIDAAQLEKLAQPLAKNGYGQYLCACSVKEDALKQGLVSDALMIYNQRITTFEKQDAHYPGY